MRSLHLIIILSNKVWKLFDFNSYFHFIAGNEVENNKLIVVSNIDEGIVGHTHLPPAIMAHTLVATYDYDISVHPLV